MDNENPVAILIFIAPKFYPSRTMKDRHLMITTVIVIILTIALLARTLNNWLCLTGGRLHWSPYNLASGSDLYNHGMESIFYSGCFLEPLLPKLLIMDSDCEFNFIGFLNPVGIVGEWVMT